MSPTKVCALFKFNTFRAFDSIAGQSGMKSPTLDLSCESLQFNEKREKRRAK